MRKHKCEFRFVPTRYGKLFAYDIKDIVQKNTGEYILLPTNTICSGLPDGKWNLGVGQDARLMDFYRAWVEDAQMHIRAIEGRGVVRWGRRGGGDEKA